jgi:hypothetical protein
MKTLLMGAAASVLAYAAIGGGAAMAEIGPGGPPPSAIGESGDLPPNALPGHCYGKLLIPEQYESYTDQVVATAARTELHIIPAVMGETTQQVVASEAHIEYETIPATYRTVTETITVKPATTRKVTIPATYGTETEQVLVREAHTVWKRGDRSPTDIVVPGSSKLLPTGEVLCLVQVPAEYRSVTRQVVRTPETTREVIEPAETTTITRQVVDQVARVVEHQVPATYKTVKVITVVQPERTETVTIPATYATITKQRIVSQSHFEWREVQCQAESGPPPSGQLGYNGPPPPRVHDLPPISHGPVVSEHSYSSTTTTTTTTTGAAYVHSGESRTRALQAALKQRGYYGGPISGRFTSDTQQAMLHFQRDKKLVRGQFTRETAIALGIDQPPVGS